MSEFEKSERQALLEVRFFIAKHGTKEVNAYCQQRLHDISMDAGPRPITKRDALARKTDRKQLTDDLHTYLELPGIQKMRAGSQKVGIPTKEKSE